MNKTVYLSAILIIASLSLFSQNFTGDTLKPYYVYVPLITFDEGSYVNGNNYTSDGNYSLPCELIDFIAFCDNESTKFQWSTISETNASHFNITIIYPDGRFIVSENIAASGNSNSILHYESETHMQYPTGSIAKLTQTDYDGNTHELAIESINMNQNGNNITEFKIIKDLNLITAVWNSDTRLNTTVSVYSIDGKLLSIWNGDSETGMNYSNSFYLDPGSTYIFVITTAYERQSIKTVL